MPSANQSCPSTWASSRLVTSSRFESRRPSNASEKRKEPYKRNSCTTLRNATDCSSERPRSPKSVRPRNVNSSCWSHQCRTNTAAAYPQARRTATSRRAILDSMTSTSLCDNSMAPQPTTSAPISNLESGSTGNSPTQ